MNEGTTKVILVGGITVLSMTGAVLGHPETMWGLLLAFIALLA